MNKWAESILYDKATGSNEIHTDGLTTVDESVQIESEIAEKGSQSEVISKDGEVQTNKITFHDIAMQAECVETTDKNSDQAQQIADLQSENGLLEVKIEELRSIIIRLKADLQSKNSLLEKENRELRSIIERLKKDYRELVEVTDKQEKEFLVELKAKSEMIECQGRELTELRAEFTDKINELLERVGEVRKINSLMWLNEGLDEDLQGKNQKLAEQEKLIEQLQKERKQVESQLEADIKRLQEEKRDQLAEIDRLKKKLESSQNVAILSVKAHIDTLDENLTLRNQKIENSPAEDEQQNGKLTEKDIQGQTKTKAPDAVSLVSTLTEKAKKEYTPNSSMSHTIASIHSSNRQKIVKVGS